MMTTYISLLDNKYLKGFNFSEYYTQEQTVIKPALEKDGYTDIQFFMGERDSFGPLSRIITARDKNGVMVKFIYG